jgi:HAD superfamily hydrolase (TIGR01549 family)
MPEYDAYLFDCDGTVVNTLDIWIDACQKVLADHGVQVSRAEIGARLGKWELMLAGIPEEEFTQAMQEVIAIAHPQVAHAPLYEGVKLVLQRLKADGKKLALITASDKVVIDAVLAHHNLENMFDLLVTADDVGKHKPDPEGLFLAMQHFNVAKDRAVMLGDSDKDLGAAKNAGIDSILFYPESHRAAHDQAFLKSFGPKYVISHWNELASAAVDATI